MSQIEMNPHDMRQFARELAEAINFIHSRDLRLRAEVMDLGTTWGDEKYRTFARSCTEMTDQLANFYKMAEYYVDFLDAKAAAAERYLRG